MRLSKLLALVLSMTIFCSAAYAYFSYCELSCTGGITYVSPNLEIEPHAFACSAGDFDLCGGHSFTVVILGWDSTTNAYDIIKASLGCTNISLACAQTSNAYFFDLSNCGLVHGTKYEAKVTVWDENCPASTATEVCSFSDTFTY